MAKSENFFIRAKVTYDDAGTFAQTEIDLGSFVNLGIAKSTLLRVHGLQVGYRDSAGINFPTPAGAGTICNVAWQLTTQSQTAIVDMTNKSVVACGGLVGASDAQTGGIPQLLTDVVDLNPSNFQSGYLIGVDSMFLSVDGDNDWIGDFDVCIMMECTLENATQATALSLSLSQV